MENTIQDAETSTCSQFQLYLYKNLFDPNNKSKILNHKKLTKQTLQTIINEMFSLILKKTNILKSLAKNLICNFILGKIY